MDRNKSDRRRYAEMTPEQRERILERNRAYYKKCKQKILSQKKEYYKENHDKIRAYQAEYWAVNKKVLTPINNTYRDKHRSRNNMLERFRWSKEQYGEYWKSHRLLIKLGEVK